MIDIWSEMLFAMARFFEPYIFPVIGLSLIGGVIVCLLSTYRNL